MAESFVRMIEFCDLEYQNNDVNQDFCSFFGQGFASRKPFTSRAFPANPEGAAVASVIKVYSVTQYFSEKVQLFGLFAVQSCKQQKEQSGDKGIKRQYNIR